MLPSWPQPCRANTILPCLIQIYLWFIIQKSGSRQEVHRPPWSALMHLLNLLCVWSLRGPRRSRLTTPLSLSRSVHRAPPDGVIIGQLPAPVSLRLSSRRNRCLSPWLLYPRGSCRSDVKHFQGVNGDLTSQHVATTDRTFMRLGQTSSLKKHLGSFLITIWNISQLWIVKLAS